MVTRKSPRKGSLQFWPRKRANKFLPRVNWDVVNSVGKSLKGFIGYKVGMVSLYVKDNTNDSMTKGKNIAVPSTILECPGMKIYSVRFYKDNKLVTEVLSENFDKELKRAVKLPGKKDGKKIDDVKSQEYNDVKVICYSLVKKIGLKKKPDLSEIGLKGSLEEKMHFIKEKIGKEISIIDVFGKGELVDLRGLTKGKGLSGPVRRFGIQLKNQKSEKGRRRPGSLGPWHPARVIFRVPMAGQLGMFTRVVYNNKILDLGKSEGKFKNIKNYGDVKTDYIIVKGSVQGPAKRQLLITTPLRETKKTKKKNYELIEIR
ncbi:MAG: large subunit ribosomal protein L3 [archaeon GW2011_AR13]|nr:50S ribosomal protein L3P [uncultured archaeon]KHO50290.1 MAG: large subunit ribosomal protein L3 [archaeon GW2011_AR13]HIG95183.1 50S ribosomal protein L3 [Nanoarchaeota archaeon]HIH63424.1 50S ribosomal protein L3 [Nanoarchaeota archaeon]HIJ09813.1 50S ribosomal protein L3 [Nanoarchaeota archaeon]